MKKILSCLLFFSPFCVRAQSGALVFNDSILHELHIQTSLSSWFDTLQYDFQQNMANSDLYPERYHECKITWDGILLDSCGFREKGNASNTLTNFSRKKPLKISFDEYVSQSLDGLKKINLNNFTNDPSLLHDAVANKLFRDAGIAAPRTSYVKVWVNDEYIGLYVTIENVDKTFLKSKYGGANNDGNLYKTDRGASVSLDWQGNDPSAYEDQGFKLTTNTDIADWSVMIGFIDVLNNDPDNLKDYLETHFDIHTYLKILAIEKLIRSWDSYWGGGNNFYMYEHPDGMIRWIPWDENETFQDIRVISGTPLLDGYLVPTNKFDKRPLLKRIFEVEEFQNEYLDDACELIHSDLSLEHIGKYILDCHNLVAETYRDDPNKIDSYDAFEYSLTDDNLDEVSVSHNAYVVRIRYPGIYPFILSQREWAVKQMKGWDHDCSIEDHSIYDLTVFPNPAGDYVNIANDSASSFDYSQFQLYNFAGKLCRNIRYNAIEGNYFTMRLDGLPGGIYLLLKNSADGRTGRAKLIVK